MQVVLQDLFSILQDAVYLPRENNYPKLPLTSMIVPYNSKAYTAGSQRLLIFLSNHQGLLLSWAILLLPINELNKAPDPTTILQDERGKMISSDS